MSETLRVPVLIAGAGPVGLAAAIELGQRGVGCLVVERHDRVGYAPRAKTTNVRTREHLRRWGIADRLRDASPFGVDYPSTVHFVTRLAGHSLARFENAFYCNPARNPFYSEHAQWIPQYALEEVLRAHAATLAPVAIRFEHELSSFAQDETRVTARIRNAAGGELIVEADWLIGADGARSAVRQGIGAKMEGKYGLSRNYSVVFRARGLAEAHRHGPGIMYWHVNPDVPCLMGPMDRGDQWFFAPTNVPEGVKFAASDAPALIRKTTGIDLPYHVVSSDEWVASRLLADRYRDRRVLLAGDACHLHPPFGGYGMNMGISDAVDLGWKLAALLQGWGGPGLLDAYQRERRPVHNYVMDEAVANHALLGNQLWQDGLEDATDAGALLRREVGARIQAAKVREFNTLGVVLGSRYEDSPLLATDHREPPARDFRNYVPSAHPGCLAPHAWLGDGSSLYDRFGAGFTLLVTRDAKAAEVDRARVAAKGLRLPLTVFEPGSREVADSYCARYALIRPDQHVAWRGDELLEPLEPLFRKVTGHG